MDLAVSDVGLGEPALLWAHGFGDSMGSEDKRALLDFERLATRNRIVRWDARGCGHSGSGGGPDAYLWDALGRDTIDVAAGLDIGEFCAGGVSMGAATALHAAIAAPDSVVGLVLVLPPTGYDSRPTESERYRLDAVLVERRGVDAFIEGTQARTGFHFVPSVKETVFPAVLRGAAGSDLPPRHLVRSISAPALILTLEGDRGHPLGVAEELAGMLEMARLIVVDDPRNVGQWTRPTQDFLASIRG